MFGKCRKCGASITFLVMNSGKKMPVDAMPVAMRLAPHGPHTAVRVAADNAQIVRGHFVSDGLEVYAPHGATCPCAQEFRRGR